MVKKLRKDLATRIRAAEAPLAAAWTHLVQGSGIAFAQRPAPQIHGSCVAGLLAVVRVLEGAPADPQSPSGNLFGHGELMVGATQVDTVLAFLLGRQAVVDHLGVEFNPGRSLDTSHALNEAFGDVISAYGRASCAVCMGRQDERRVQAEERLNRVIERSQDAIVLFDDRRVVQSWNFGAEALFGYSREEMQGQSLDRILPPEMSEPGHVEDLMVKIHTRGHARISETRRMRKDGSLVWVDANYTAVDNPEGAGLSVWVIFRDISERKRVTEENLQSERLALIGTMSAKLAHEVRNPLTSIVLNLDLVQESLKELPPPDKAAGEVREMLGSIGMEVQRIQNVVEDYLRFARLPQLRLEPTQLDEMLRQHLGLVRTELGGRGIELQLALGAGPAQIMADEPQLWQAILNLVRNGMEAMPEGGRMRVTTRAQHDSVECEVSDSGVGMDLATRESIFRPFFSTKRGGTGLGLPLTQQVVAEHRGRLVCHSEPGLGTRFILTFARIPGAAGRPAPPPVASRPEGSS